MTYKMLILLAIPVYTLLIGCQEEKKSPARSGVNQQPPESTGPKELTIDQMKPAHVIVSVNGAGLTKYAFDRQLGAIKKSLQKDNANNPLLSQQRLRDEMMKIIPRFIETQLLFQDAQGKKVLTQGQAEREVDEKFKELAQKSKTSVEALFAKSPYSYSDVRSNAIENVWIQALVASNIPPIIKVNDAFVQATIASIRAENSAITATNQMKAMRLKDLRSRIMAGQEDFDKVAAKISQSDDLEPDRGGYWGEFNRNEIQDKNMRAVIFNLRTNEISDVVEDEESVRILKVTAIKPVKTNETGVVLQPELRTVSQILLKKDPLLVEMSKELLERDVKNQMQSRAIKKYVDGLQQQATIVYPHGTNLWNRATSSGGR